MSLASVAGLGGLVFLTATVGGAAPTLDQPGNSTTAASAYTVLAWNDLGMHCMNQDFSEICILPPYNTLNAQVIRKGGEPNLVTSGLTTTFTIPGNTKSSTKTNFWTYAKKLFGVTLKPDYGLTGNTLNGVMTPKAGTTLWEVTGIPVTPIDDTGKLSPYNLATVNVNSGSTTVATTRPVVPVSWEIRCDLCHTKKGMSVASHLLSRHYALHPKAGQLAKPVLCAKCHAEPNLGSTGQPGVPSLSRAIHRSHATRMASAGLANPCYACHPGNQTQCFRDIHYQRGMTCENCHGDMMGVANATRRPWVDEPKCGSATCHHVAGHSYEQTNTLYRNSKGHGGVGCPACHNSPHAITPTVEPKDNVQAIALQGSAGTISKCTVCHTSTPKEKFFHSVGD